MTDTQGFLRHIHHCTNYDPANFLPFVVGGKEVGYVRRDTVPLIVEDDNFTLQEERLILSPPTDTIETRTEALSQIADKLSAHFDVPLVEEIYPVIQKWGDEKLALIDRAAIPWFGVKGSGVHVNGYVKKGDKIHIWVGQRAKERKIDPGKLDNMIGGGMPQGYSLEENLAKEGHEEAGLSAEQVSAAQFIHPLSYQLAMMKGLRNDTLHIFDLELPSDVMPKNTDGEVERFELIPAKDVAAIIHDTDRFKFNCNLVMIDFLLRKGIIDDSHAEYEALEGVIKDIRDV